MKKKPQATRVPLQQARQKIAHKNQDQAQPIEILVTTAVVLIALYVAAKRGYLDSLLAWWAS